MTNTIPKVYALYNKNKWIAITPTLFEISVGATNRIINIPKMHFSSVCLAVLSCDTIRVRLCIYLIDQKIVMEEYSAVDCSQANSRCEDGMGPNALGVSCFEMEHLPSSRFSVILLRDLLIDDFQQGSLLATLAFMTTPKGLAFVQS